MILQILPTHPIIRNSVEQAIQYGKPGNVIVDLSSTAPDIILELYQQAKDAGMFLLDSPVSGGNPMAIAGTLAIMTGGDKEAFDKVKPVLACMGSPVYTGGPASGSVTKLVNNMIGGAILVAIAEGYAFAAKAGIDLQTTFEATRGGFAGGPMYDNKVPKIIKRDYTPGARIAVHRKGHPERQALCPQAGHRHTADRCGPPCDGLDERQRPHRRGPGGAGQVLRGQDGREGRPGGDGRLTLVRRSISECAGTGCLSGPAHFCKEGPPALPRPS